MLLASAIGLQAAEQIGDQSGFEAAVYATLGGNLKRVLPLCKTWHDRLWAQARAWLEAALDKECRPSDPTGEVIARAATRMNDPITTSTTLIWPVRRGSATPAIPVGPMRSSVCRACA